jgi:hypothetical protein
VRYIALGQFQQHSMTEAPRSGARISLQVLGHSLTFIDVAQVLDGGQANAEIRMGGEDDASLMRRSSPQIRCDGL